MEYAMKWKIKEPPQSGDRRQRHKFAWFPTKVENYKVWLETYVVTEEYVVTFSSAGCVLSDWIETDRHLLYSV